MSGEIMNFLKNPLVRLIIIIVAGITLGVIVWLKEFEGLNQIKKLLHPPFIKAISPMRPNVETFITGEKIRLYLTNIQSEKVFWLFEEKSVLPGSVEIEYSFPYDRSQADGLVRDYRVDAFFKHGAQYRVASTIVRTQNIRYSASIDVEQSDVRLTVRNTLGDRWMLSKASLSKYEDGAFKPGFDIPVEAVESVARTTSFVIDRKTFTKVLAYPEHIDLRTQLATKKDAWVTYEFVDQARKEKLEIVQPLRTISKGP
jgi:hypothetical protein